MVAALHIIWLGHQACVVMASSGYLAGLGHLSLIEPPGPPRHWGS